MTVTTLTITRPDDWHLHLRDGEAMRSVVGATARVFGRAVVMPNLEPPVTTVAAAAAYRERIAAALPPASRFAPLLTLYLTDNTPTAEIAGGAAQWLRHRREILPRRGNHQLRLRRHRDRTRVSGARRDAEACVATAYPWRSNRVRGRHIRSRTRCSSISVLGRIVDDFPGSKSCSSTSRRGRRRTSSPRLRRRLAPRSRRSTCSTRATRSLRAASGHICTATQSSSAKCTARRCSRRQPAATPNFFSGTDSAPHARGSEGKCLRLCRLLYRARRTGTLRGGIRSSRGARQAGSLCELPRRRLLWPAPQQRHGHAQARGLDRAGGVSRSATQTVVPLNAGATMQWRGSAA